jgi:hypothetical protein
MPSLLPLPLLQAIQRHQQQLNSMIKILARIQQECDRLAAQGDYLESLTSAWYHDQLLQ